MVYVIQLLKMLNKDETNLFIDLFDDLSFEIKECGYEGLEDELISEMLVNHLGIEIIDGKQLLFLSDYIMKNQGKLQNKVDTLRKAQFLT